MQSCHSFHFALLIAERKWENIPHRGNPLLSFRFAHCGAQVGKPVSATALGFASVRNAEVMSATGTLGTVVDAEVTSAKGLDYRLGHKSGSNGAKGSRLPPWSYMSK